MHFKLTLETQTRLKQTFVAQILVGSKPSFETLTLVPRYFKYEVFRKIQHFSQFEAELVIVLLAQKKRFRVQSWTSPKSTLGKQLDVNKASI